MARLSVLVALVFCGLAAPAMAAVVTLCRTDTEGGTGASNLQAALAAGGDITFQCPAGSTILFTRTYVIHRATRIHGGNVVTLDGGDHSMFVVDGAMLSFADITLRRGNASRGRDGSHLPELRGGVVHGAGRIELLRTTVSRSVDAFWLQPGAIRILQSRILENQGITIHAPEIEIGAGTEFRSNSGTPLLSTGGSVDISDSEFVGNGTSAFSNCTLAIKRSTFNSHVGAGKGGALLINCNATIEKTDFHNNRAFHGGAIYLGADPSEVSIRRVKFVGNIASEAGGAIAVETSGRELTLTLRSSTFENNRASQGGAINLERFYGNTRSLQGFSLIFKRNAASGKGGAIYAINADLRVARGAFINNEAIEGGGAVYAMQQGERSAEFANALFAYNSSSQGGSAFQGSAARFVAATIAANEGVALWAEAPPVLPFGGNRPSVFPIRFGNSILMGSPDPACGPPVTSAPFINLGNTIQYPATSCGSEISSAYPALGPFFVPLPWSPALNNGDDGVCQAAPVHGRDIFGAKRPLLEKCSIGAVEGDLPRLLNAWLRRNPELAALFGRKK